MYAALCVALLGAFGLIGVFLLGRAVLSRMSPGYEHVNERSSHATSDNKSTTVGIPCDSANTKAFEAFALLLLREMPRTQVAAAVGETDTRLWRRLFRQVDTAYAEADFSNVGCVGVDEMSVRTGHE